ncbi:MAG: adenylate kinase [Candidatus Kaelpia aquatica]|nr:adenylate kinase [Candidatus Kaelpia aquatica]
MIGHLNMIIMGSPGAGKGTQADLIARHYKIPHISTGDMFREILKDGSSEIANELEGYVKKGELVPDEVVLKMVRMKLSGEDASSGFVLDGFPRTMEQTKGLDILLKEIEKEIDLVLYLDASVDVILERLTGRRVCIHCGANYHIKYSPAQEEGACDRCGGELYQREDDRESTIKRRLEVYKEQIEDIVSFYDQQGILFKVSGDLSAADVFNHVEKKLKDINIKVL